MVGGAITILSQYLGPTADRKERRAPLAAALAAEILAFLKSSPRSCRDGVQALSGDILGWRFQAPRFPSGR
jgi:hypothetical protein